MTSSNVESRFFGLITSADEDGIHLADAQGDEHWLPPVLDAFEPGQDVVYTLQSTGEVIESPDFVATFTVTPPDNDD